MAEDQRARSRPSVVSKTDSPLMAALAGRASRGRLAPMELAREIGIGYVYLMQLLSGKRNTASLSRKVLVSCARYLDIPVLEAYLLARAIVPEDFVHESVLQELGVDAFETMAAHPVWGGYMPTREEWDSLPGRLKLLTLFAFGEATGIELIDDKAKTSLSIPDVPARA